MVYQPTIFRTCRIIRSERLLKYYTRQPFTFGIQYELDLWNILAWMVRIADAARLHLRDMTVTLVPTWLEFWWWPLQWIHVRLSDAVTVRYEGPEDEGGSVWTLFVVLIARYMDPANRAHLQYSAPGRFAPMFSPGQGCSRSPIIFTNSVSQLGLSLLLLVYVSVSGLRL